jgi:hypothetical protein
VRRLAPDPALSQVPDPVRLRVLYRVVHPVLLPLPSLPDLVTVSVLLSTKMTTVMKSTQVDMFLTNGRILALR